MMHYFRLANNTGVAHHFFNHAGGSENVSRIEAIVPKFG